MNQENRGHGAIRVRDLCVYFNLRNGSVKAVDHITATFEEGRITGIIGESGCGKSVLGMSILGLLPDYASVRGSILFENEELIGMAPRRLREIRGRAIGLIPQNPADSLNPVRRMGGQISESFHRKFRDGAQRRGAVSSLLTAFGFTDCERIARSYPFELSGGMQQRAAAAVGVAGRPRWMVIDEPTKGLDRPLREQMYGNLDRIHNRGKVGMIVITHDLVLAGELCHETAVMYSGEIIEKGCSVVTAPLHPYTQGLIGSLPEHGMKPMTGIAPAPWEQIRGCKFADRCESCCPRCREEKPPEYDVKGSMVRCFLYA